MRFASFFTALAWFITSTTALSSSTNCVSTTSSSSSIPLVSGGKAAPIFVSEDEWPGVYRTVTDFVKDVNRVTGVTPKITNVTSSSGVSSQDGIPILVGTLGNSSLINAILSHAPSAAAPFKALNGSWEAYHAQIVSNPLPGVQKAYVIAGSDKRGTIYALYELSEQSETLTAHVHVYRWADVPIKTSKDLFLTSVACAHGTPDVKYRGIFLNDEQPALQNWAQEKFTNNYGGAGAGQAVGGDETYGASGDPTSPESGTNPATPFNRFFYTRLFELILRLKGNYLWPGRIFLAQWSSAFGVDDTHNQFLADLYGIVMGTSHEEPMMRSIPTEWNEFGSGPWDFSVNAANITQFWIVGTERAKGFEEIYTIGLRGDGDEPLAEGMDISLLENVISVQRGILSQVYNITDVAVIPQMWCLYSEFPIMAIELVSHSECRGKDGMRVEDDVTLLWTDDNWGNIIRFPVADERNRSGGAGVYYHVGDPRDYKWIQSTQLAKTWQQMSLAYERDARTIWVVNVGDMKPYEMAIEFFLTYGYDVSRFNQTNVNSFIDNWAAREFNLPASQANIVTEIMNNVTRWNMRRKPELLNSTTYSLINYREADIVLAGWEATVQSSTNIYNSLSESMKPAFFELVHHPVLASANLQQMWILAGRNNLYASQARLSTNNLADQVEELFETDYDLEVQYHSLLGGKWDHMMDQTHINYVYWQQPMQNVMPAVNRVPAKKQALPGPMRIALEASMGAWPGDDMFDCAQEYSCAPPDMLPLDPFTPVQSRWMDISAGGPNPFTWAVTSNVSWLSISPSHGSISTSNTDTRVELSVDWSKLSAGTSFASLIVSANATGQPVETQQIFFVANKTTVPSDFKGFVEGDGGISIVAAHTTRNVEVNGVTWTEIPNYGKTVSGMTPMPALGNNDANFSVGAGPSMEYDFYSFNNINGSVNVHVMVSPILNAYGLDRPVAFATQLDDDEPQAQYFIPMAPPGDLPPQWDTDDGWVANSIVDVVSTHIAAPGAHTLKVFMIEPAVVVEKIVIDTGGVRPSYLGPPESVQV
ncbi:hypothetical protein Clacol_008284 [Clathrus columnatus]|uniref:Gylcosyl hydrolase 115 C-terminal domain-containing protein n=1 Tax=Clathrus columnatus TaxID=1419009 RepID=A0AAV5AHA4_9AGAM|nr:hypothetical protein Clacol_008284 [Clathrus columnatus]